MGLGLLDIDLYHGLILSHSSGQDSGQFMSTKFGGVASSSQR